MIKKILELFKKKKEPQVREETPLDPEIVRLLDKAWEILNEEELAPSLSKNDFYFDEYMKYFKNKDELIKCCDDEIETLEYSLIEWKRLREILDEQKSTKNN